jgi:hypothetical protein
MITTEKYASRQFTIADEKPTLSCTVAPLNDLAKG